MKIACPHRWDLTPREAIDLQRELARRVIARGRLRRISLIAGVDLGFMPSGTEAVAGIIVYSFPDLTEVERVHARSRVRYPYIPGLLTFREGPAILKAFAQLAHEPDVVIFDGQGLAHPRRIGIASHMGLVLDKPAIGCAKSRLCGVHDEPGARKGECADLVDEVSGEIIGAVVRTRDGIKPIYVSVGHKLSLDSAVEIVLACTDRTRIPKPTREADRYVRTLTRRDTR